MKIFFSLISDLFSSDQAEDPVLGGGGAGAIGGPDDGGGLHVRGHLSGRHPPGVHTLCQHGHCCARPPVHPYDHGPLQAVSDPKQDHRAYHQAIQDLQGRGADQ